MTNYRIICRNDWTQQVHSDEQFAGTAAELERKVGEIWNASFGHMASRGNALRAYEGGSVVQTITDYDDDE